MMKQLPWEPPQRRVYLLLHVILLPSRIALSHRSHSSFRPSELGCCCIFLHTDTHTHRHTGSSFFLHSDSINNPASRKTKLNLFHAADVEYITYRSRSIYIFVHYHRERVVQLTFYLCKIPPSGPYTMSAGSRNNVIISRLLLLLLLA